MKPSTRAMAQSGEQFAAQVQKVLTLIQQLREAERPNSLNIEKSVKLTPKQAKKWPR
jgi:hypothetical protein